MRGRRGLTGTLFTMALLGVWVGGAGAESSGGVEKGVPGSGPEVEGREVEGLAGPVGTGPDSNLPCADSSSVRVVGQVLSGGNPVPFASVSVQGIDGVWEADESGRFLLSCLPPGEGILLVSALGYETRKESYAAQEGGVETLEVELRASALEMNPIVVTGTRKETFVSESPVKVDVVNVSMLRRNASDNLMESLGHVNGLYTQVDCGICYPNNIRINGMEGPYTAVLIDGAPIMSALASVYGLNGINPSMIERIEILKGPSSTLYGSEAMAGVVNVITKDPRFTPRYSLDVRGMDTGERIVDFSLSPGMEGLRGLVSGSLHHMDRFQDDNGDGFTDLPLTEKASLFGKVSWRPDGRERLGLAAKYYYEDRFGGTRAWTPRHRGSDQVYGESVYTRRVEVLGSYRPAWRSDLRAEFSYTWHDQDAAYGDVPYRGTQQTWFGNLLWDGDWGEDHSLLAGLTARYQIHDDNTVATPVADTRFIPGVFLQDEFAPSWRWSVLGGLRLDHHDEHGVIPSPRLSLKWKPFEDGKTTLRVNGGTGFRVVNVFSEEFANIVHGSRSVVIAEKLDPERSWSLTGNVNQALDLGENPMMVDLDLFYTFFSNQIVPDYDQDPSLVVFRNLQGRAVSRGLSLSLNQNFGHIPLLYSLGITLQDVFTDVDGMREPITFSSDYRGVFSVSYTFPGDVTLDYTGSVVGPMRLPSYDPPFQRPTRSSVYSIHNVQATVDVGRGLQIYGSVKNLFDYAQGSPLVDPANPFGENFDTAYVYGPIYGRQFLAGFRWAASR